MGHEYYKPRMNQCRMTEVTGCQELQRQLYIPFQTQTPPRTHPHLHLLLDQVPPAVQQQAAALRRQPPRAQRRKRRRAQRHLPSLPEVAHRLGHVQHGSAVHGALAGPVVLHLAVVPHAAVQTHAHAEAPAQQQV